ncbi:MAG: hypothetical protein F6K23_16340 [Okeania sp. SIO2C9]|uniref:hypothetical protein n=1 Tax=unclassified Okeania TaxID=2634635 RepID=UPI0013C05A48|nr:MULTISPECIES: hypothetical protein [unclassified Okeania]NEQ74463.1 hypothetical protein [Okeania sp. SIO2C9]NET26769.1 hypothetical protein [Okeania sp. SIO1I7]
MPNKKLSLEISESLYEKLEELSELTEEPINTLIIRIIAMRMPSLLRETKEFNQMLDAITPEQLHGEIGLEEVLSEQF